MVFSLVSWQGSDIGEYIMVPIMFKEDWPSAFIAFIIYKGIDEEILLTILALKPSCNTRVVSGGNSS
jgi:hypothetical protein